MEKKLTCKPKQVKLQPRRRTVQEQPISQCFKNRAVKLNNTRYLGAFSKYRQNVYVKLDLSKTKQIKKKCGKITFSQPNSLKINQMIKNQLNHISQDSNGKINCKFPRQIIDILYRYRVPNYNPFINALQFTYKQQDLVEKDRIRDLCFIGLGKSTIKKQSYIKNPSYSRTNILTRSYMLGIMKQQIQKHEQANQKAIFLPIQETALSFSYKEYPSKLLGVISQPNYQIIIKNVNKIIEKQYIRYKKGSSINNIQLTKPEIGTVFVTIILFTAFILTKNILLAYSVPIIVFLGLILSAYQCKTKINALHDTRNICDSITKKLKAYFDSINTPFLSFKVGKDFYWLQINYKHKKTPYMFQQNNRARKKMQKPKNNVRDEQSQIEDN